MTGEWNDPDSYDGGTSGDPVRPSNADGDAVVRSMLRDLPKLQMPPAVYDRIAQAIASEARSRQAAPAVSSLSERRLRHSRAGRSRIWALAGGGVAAAAVTAVAVVLVGQQPSPVSPPRAAVIAMNTSGTTYTGLNLAKQVGARWRSMRTSPALTAPSIPNGPDRSTTDVVLAPASDSPLSSDVVASSFTRSQHEVAECLGRVAPGSHPVMIDLASYHKDSEPSAAPAAVLAFDQPDTDMLDVYVVDPLCATDGAHAMAHVTATSASQ